MRLLVDSPQRVEDGSARGATAQDGLVADWGKIGALLQRSEHAGERDHLAKEQKTRLSNIRTFKGAEHTRSPCNYQFGRFYPRGRPHVPRETNAILLLVLVNEFLVGRHGAASLPQGLQRTLQLQLSSAEGVECAFIGIANAHMTSCDLISRSTSAKVSLFPVK